MDAPFYESKLFSIYMKWEIGFGLFFLFIIFLGHLGDSCIEAIENMGTSNLKISSSISNALFYVFDIQYLGFHTYISICRESNYW